MTITYKQYKLLQSFFFACHCQYIEKIPTNFGHWSNLLDDRGINWRIQNLVSYLAESKENTAFYLSTLLNQNNITISE